MKTLHLTTKKSKAKDTFTTIAGVMEEIARLAKMGEAPDGVSVVCAPGTYAVNEAMVFEPGLMPITFTAKKAGETIFDGGVHIRKWTKAKLNGKDALCADVPAECIADNSLPQVFFNGKRGSNAPWPKNKEGFAPADIPQDDTVKDYFPLKERVFKKEWAKDKGLQAVVIHLWSESNLAVTGFDDKNNYVKLNPQITYAVRASSRLFLKNLKEAFTEPGEYYFDLKAKKLYYLPEKGETEVDCVIPGHFPIAVVAGIPEKEIYVENINFEGIVFQYAGGGRPHYGKVYDLCQDNLPKIPNGFNTYMFELAAKESQVMNDASNQSEVHLPGILTYNGAHNCNIKDCRIEKCGWNGIHFAFGCENMNVTGCEITDMGGGGIYICGPSSKIRTNATDTRKITITENHIHKCGRYYLCAVGINVGNTKGVLVEHNDIDDLFYTGISVGWVWGYAESPTAEIRIGFNHIYNIGQGMLCDMGGVYLLGTEPGTRVYNNMIHDVTCRFYGGWALYTDEGSSYIILENNICYNCSKESCHQHYGRENIYRFNICAFNLNAGFNVSDGTRRQTGYEYPGENYRYNVTCISNVIVTNGEPFFCSWKKENITEQFYCDMNCYWDMSGGKSKFAVTYLRGGIGEIFYDSFKDWQKAGHDLHSIIADPGFVNLEKKDFRLKKNSILRKLNFPDPEITLTQAGRTQK